MCQGTVLWKSQLCSGHNQDPLLGALDCVAVGGRSFLTSRCLPGQKTPFQTFVQLHLLVDNAQYSNFAQQMSLIATYS